MNGDSAGHRELSHLDAEGRVKMVDTGDKPVTRREARASGRVLMNAETARVIRERSAGKGDVLAAARIAGIMAAKKTASLVPLCHPVALQSVTIDLQITGNAVEISATAVAVDRTGVEMEALVAVSVAALTIYDMCKSLDRGMIIESIRLEEKSGGASGHYLREANQP
jgi:cyclic pyranopterin phosphate synthase